MSGRTPYARGSTLHSAGTATANGGSISVAGYPSLGIQLSGTWAGTLTFEANIDGTNWGTVIATNTATGGTATVANANGLYTIKTAGLNEARARISAYTSGTVVAYALATMAEP